MPPRRKRRLSPTPTRVSKRTRQTRDQPNPRDATITTPTSDKIPSESSELELDYDIPEVIRSRPYSGSKNPRTQLALGLPPLHRLSDIYKSLTTRALELDFDEFLSHLGSQQLRVVTVCSGTESPLLALEMIQENLQKYFNRDFQFRHLFSAEIVPFKQAYIERNFHPRFIFRDVAELKNRVAQTAYGSLEKIPKNPDILIAGFSCVDFSGLNNKRKTLDDKGESGGTFWGIIRYAKTYRPRMVILENVKTAPWDKIEQHWNEIDYLTVHADVDTKAYYLPQTRERGYMFCVDRKLMTRNNLTEEDILGWADVFGAFKRPASSPAGMFLMDADDRRLEQIEKDMAIRITSSVSRATVNWARYQVRHQSYRLNQGLGHRRPVSKSQDDGTCQMPDFAWQTWVKSLPERVWDTIDVNFLRKLVEGYDMNYKERCIELSQGVEREIDSRAYGIIGCITPCGIPYITTRGGPLCGLESLVLQGLPLDRLLLTQESQRELQDLAGNAMSSTVIGAAILSALIVGHKVLKQGQTLSAPKTAAAKRRNIVPREDDILVPSNIRLGSSLDVDLSALQRHAASSARYCMCERQTSIEANILKCTLCGHAACSSCGGNPPHAYERWTGLVRSPPLDFAAELRDILPSRLVVSGISPESYIGLEQELPPGCLSGVWKDFLDAVTRAVGDELRFLEIKRSEVWTVVYEGKFSILSLVIEGTTIQWLFFAKPRETEPALCLIREILSTPIARMVPYSGSILEGTWTICSPLSSSCTLGFSGAGNRSQSYEAKCGLELEEYTDSKVWTQLNIQGTDEDVKDLETDIRGTYDLLPDCGTANACLHRRSAVGDNPAVYLFLDPTKLGEPKNDSFVFSLEHRRNFGYSTRLKIAEVSHKWRSSKATETDEFVTVYYRKWVSVRTAMLASSDVRSSIRYHNLDPAAFVSISDSGCRHANVTLLSLAAPATTIRSAWKSTAWDVIDPADSPHLLKELTWLLQKPAGVPDFRDWKPVASSLISPEEEKVCTVCVPPKPKLLWGRNRRGWTKVYEDPHDAALYERQIKSRPSPFLIFCRAEENGLLGHLRVTLNIQTLLHQAFAKLTQGKQTGEVSFNWRLVPNSYDTRNLTFPNFSLKSNRDDIQSLQPPGFLLDLRPEQLRSLSWMIKQEQDDVKAFVEEEIEEALLPSLLWRAEGRATTLKTVRGGVLADDVGYGKTAIVLGLINSQHEIATAAEPTAGFIPSKATLIVVPHIMIQQWQSEIVKFLGTKYRVLAFQSSVALTKACIRDISNGDIILVSWAVFNSPGYYQRMQKFTGTPRVPGKAGRSFDEWFAAAQESLGEHVQVLMDQGPGAFLEAVRAKREKVKDAQENYTYLPSTRLRGKQYELANKNVEPGTKSAMPYAEISSDDDEESEISDEEDPEVLRARVDRFLNLIPARSLGAKDGALAMTSTDEDTEYEDSSSEKHVRKKQSAKAKPKPISSRWDDRKEFNISQNSKSQPWETVQVPLLHAFEFNRLVIDEFTYANTDRLNPLIALRAKSKWVLSGTPPLNDFADVNTIAPFLGVHLGIDDEDMQTQNKRLRALRKQRSQAETFQSFRAPRSEAWHRRRHEMAQKFLDHFVRRNVAEIDEIPSSEHIVLVQQSPAEKAIYLELYKQLMTYNRQLRRSGRGRFGSDQATRVDEIISGSSTAEEALLKRCTSLALQGRWVNGKPEVTTCQSLIKIREGQLAKLHEDLDKKLRLAAWVYCACDVKHENFHNFIESIVRHDFGDMTVTGQVYPLLKTAILTSEPDDWRPFFASPAQAKPSPIDDASDTEPKETDVEDTTAEKPKNPPKPAPKKSKEMPPLLPTRPVRAREFEPTLREITTTLRNLIVEWVLRERALRFLKTIRQVQTSPEILPCQRGCKDHSNSQMNILGSCGHLLCSACIPDTILKEECPVEGCRGSGKRFNIISASSLGCDQEDTSPQYGGSKIDKLIDIIRGIPADERVLLFIQFPELMETASKALQLAGIKHTSISATDRKSTQKVEKFQKTSFGEDKVLILKLGSEMAAGLNLQCANHVIFLSPLLAQTQYDYDSAMIQAIGRARRYGQTRHVHVYHLLAKMTIDVNIFQDRRGGKFLIERDGEAVLVSKDDDAVESEAISCQGPSLLVDNAF
ncbi:hypothetical protein ARAM_000893 [Aspergillus rambellii]|uniref:Helicase C-terminal domain-containing protein n=1 Tax=Aspergillus rambellii TaxID=308745 RepID=A0A0F8WQA7_9EURO|nr:hypothetical protein ARAM_000893 [Aspergillus rambellii]